MKRTLVAIALLALITGCGSGQSNSQSSTQASGGASAPAAPAEGATNNTGFPLYQNSTVLSSKDFTQTAGAQSVSGTEVIAENPATIAQLGDWIKGLGTTPPAGYTVAPSNSGMDTGRAKAAAMGVQFQVFTHEVDGKKRAMVVLAVDPKTFDAKAGFVLSAIGKFRMLPQSMKDVIDAQAKARSGYSISDALNPDTPIGAAIAAVDALQASGNRGVVLIDGSKN
jgi:hypothetical protein